LRPSKALGQNFLADEYHLAEIVSASELADGDEVLEVGAGLGSLSRYLAEKAKRLVVVELDGKLLPLLRDNLSSYQNVEIIKGDIFELNLSDVFSIPGYQVIANIPYYLTSKLIRHLLEQEQKPAKLALTVQKEVAERACASPPKMSLLSLSVQLYGSPRIAHHIPAGAFYPVPKVDSALLIVDIYEQAKFPAEQIDAFFRFTKAAFQQKRKTLANSLAGLPGWSKEYAIEQLLAAEIDPQRRPQTLDMEEWGRLAKVEEV
jgi:16S rRNA (adenine1518-N6/adenine1519-N6)-dimethyltransferase